MMLNTKWTLGLLLALLAVGTQLPAQEKDADASEKHSLRYKFATGDIIRTKVVHLVTVETRMQGHSQTAQSRSISVKNWEVESVDPEGLATFIHSVENINMWQKVTDRPEQSYDSSKDATPPQIFTEAAKSVGIPLTRFTVRPSGQLVKREKITGGSSSGEQIMLTMPEEPVAIGAQWSEPDELTVQDQNGRLKRIKTRQMYRLDRVANGVAEITVESQVLTPINDPSIRVELIQKLTKGKVRFDIDAGRVLSQQLDLDETVIGFKGEASLMKYLGRMSEELLTGEEPTDEAEVKTATKPEPVEAK
ncbi:MAG: hypothetical protein WD045_08340 [Pirellulaceae bacterium]